jgi:hypothetical protein
MGMINSWDETGIFGFAEIALVDTVGLTSSESESNCN